MEASGGMVYTAAYKTEPVMMTLFSADSFSEKKEKSEIEAIAENLKSILVIGSGDQYQILTHTGDVGFITLDKHLTAESDTDSDGDGLSDWEEVDTGFIAKYMEYEYGYSELSVPDNGYKISNEDLPTISYVLQYYDWKSYMKNVPVKLMRFASQTHVYYTIRLLPIISDPTSIDSDGDGYWDCIDNILDKSVYTIEDSQPLKHNKSSKTPFAYIPARRTYESKVSKLLNYDHQKYLYFLAAEYDEVKIEYFESKGYEIDGYLLIGILFGESGVGQDSDNLIGELYPLGSKASQKAEERTKSALLSSGIIDNEKQMENLILNDNFYLATARILGYLDNAYDLSINGESRIEWIFSSLLQANPNVARWRNAIVDFIFEDNTYEYRGYDFQDHQGKYQEPNYPWGYYYDEYVNETSWYYKTAYDAISEYERKVGRDFWNPMLW